jgi:amicyanin
MNARIVAWIGGALIIAAVIIGGVGAVVAMAQGNATPWRSSGMIGSSSMGSAPMGGSGMGGMNGGKNGGKNGGMNGGMMGGMNGGMMGGAQQTPASTPAANVTQVTIQNFAYSPSNIQVKVGTTVTWTNQDSAPHTVTFKNGMKDSGLLRQGQSFSYTFTTPGTFDYYCTLHSNMVAHVVVTA